MRLLAEHGAVVNALDEACGRTAGTRTAAKSQVAVVRLLVAEDAGRVANVLKKMIKPV